MSYVGEASKTPVAERGSTFINTLAAYNNAVKEGPLLTRFITDKSTRDLGGLLGFLGEMALLSGITGLGYAAIRREEDYIHGTVKEDNVKYL